MAGGWGAMHSGRGQGHLIGMVPITWLLDEVRAPGGSERPGGLLQGDFLRFFLFENNFGRNQRGLGFRVLPQAVPYSETLAQDWHRVSTSPGLHDTVVFGLSPPLLHIYFCIPFSYPVPIADIC